MLRIAGRTMTPQTAFIFRDAAKTPLLRMRGNTKSGHLKEEWPDICKDICEMQ